MKVFPLLLLMVLLCVCHGVCAQSVSEQFTMSGKFKLDDSNAEAKSSSWGKSKSHLVTIQNATILKESEENEVVGTALHRCQSSLETSIQKMERMVEEFNVELDTLEHNLKKKEKQAQSAEDRAREARRKLTEAESELGYMHTQAVSTYVNSTLMKEDVVNSIKKRISGTVSYVGNCYRRRFSHRIRRAKQLYSAELRRQQPNIASLKRNITRLTKTVESRWAKSTLLRPFVQRTMKAASKKIYAKMEPSLKVAKEAAYLSLVSAVEEVSRAGITYLDALTEKQKVKASLDQERLLGRRRRTIKDRHDRPKGRNVRKKRDDEDFHFTASLLQRKVKGTLEYGLQNSKLIANRCTELLPLAVSLLVTRKLVLGSVLLLLGVPTTFIWLICLVKFLVRLLKRFSSLR